MRESPRIRRLRSDHKALQTLADESSIFSYSGHGEPPELYVVRFSGRGLWKSEGPGDVQFQSLHEVHIRLGAAYPRMMPELAWKTPIFHPNISASGVVCLGGYGTYWVPSLTLDELCVMLWDMIRYENYDETSPYNRDAANWIKNQIHYRLPLDPRPLRDRKAGYAVPISAEIVADKPKSKTKVKKESSAGRWKEGSSSGTPSPPRTLPAPPPRPAPPPVEAEVIFLDDGPSQPRPMVVPAQSREEGGIVFIE
jgi:ubiquitin-protein ligase